MPKIFKGLWGAEANNYIFQPAEELKVETNQPIKNMGAAREEPASPAPRPASESTPAPESEPPQESTPEVDPLAFARVQAEAILEDARSEAEQYREQLRAEMEAEAEEARRAAREEGDQRGYAEGLAQSAQEGKEERERMAREQIKGIEAFLESAARARDRMLDDCREELKDLALTIAEKVIHVSLRNSSDIILRMVDAATDTHKRCEWAHVYVADCDVGGKAYTVPELTAALSHIAERVRVIPMPDEESGTCIVELPDVILDASVSTQLGNIKDVLDGAGPDGVF